MRLPVAVGVLIAIPLAGYVVALLLGVEVVPATLAVCITTPPSVLTLLGIVRLSVARPEYGPVAALAGTFTRMVWAAGVVAVLQGRAALFETTATAVAQWTTGFYLLTLAVETVLLWRLLDRPIGPTKGPPNGHAP